MTNTSTKKLAISAMLTASIAIGAWISIPSTIPFTLQTLFIYFAVLFMKAKYSALSITVYIMLGAIGLPVFSNFTSGLGILFGATGGYIFGFLLFPLCYAIFTSILKENDFSRILSLIVGTLLCYIAGTIMFVNVALTKSGAKYSFAAAFSICVIPYIIPDMIKLIIAFIADKRIKKIIKSDF